MIISLKNGKISFNKSYKIKEEFKLIVKTDNLNNLKIEDIKEALIKLIPNVKFEIFKDDPSKFEKIINFLHLKLKKIIKYLLILFNYNFP